MSTVHIGGDLLRPVALELRHLRLVLAITELGSLTRAGERLHLTQSALSHSLREIEDRLGVQLFLRVGKRLVATEAGDRLADSARAILLQVVGAEDDLLERSHDRRGTIRITTECYTCYNWLPPLLQRFEKAYPDVRVQIVAEATGRSIEALLDGSVDLALTTNAPKLKELKARPLFNDELLLVTSAQHRLASKAYVVPEDLADEKVILYTPPTSSNFYSQFFGGSGVEPREVAQIQLTEAMLAMIAAGIGVGALARWAIHSELRRGHLATVQLGKKGMRRLWSALTRSSDRPTKYTDDFIDLIIEKAAPGVFESRCA